LIEYLKKDQEATIGIDFLYKTVEHEDEKIKVQVWDTAGQERFNTISSTYYRAAQGVIIVYDITKRGTFTALDDWFEEVSRFAPKNAIVAVVGNKSDASPREITTEEGQKYAATRNPPVAFYEITAKDTGAVNNIFMNLVAAICITQRDQRKL